MFYKVCTGIALCMLGVVFYDYYTNAHPTTLTCNYDKQFIMDNFQRWVKNDVSDAQLKTYKLEVVDAHGFTEYATPPKGKIPPIKGSFLYDDLKGAVVCNATVMVDFSPSRIRVLSQRFAHRIHPLPYMRRRIGIEERQIRQAHIAKSRFVAQAAGGSFVVPHFLMRIHLRVVPSGKSQVMGEIIGQYRRRGQPLDRMHPNGVTAEPSPPTDTLHRQIAAIGMGIFRIIDIPPFPVKPIFRCCFRFDGIAEDTGIAHCPIA